MTPCDPHSRRVSLFFGTLCTLGENPLDSLVFAATTRSPLGSSFDKVTLVDPGTFQSKPWGYDSQKERLEGVVQIYDSVGTPKK